MGLGTEEIADYLVHGGEEAELLAVPKAHLRDLERSVEEIRLRVANGPSISVQMMTLPAVTFLARRC